MKQITFVLEDPDTIHILWNNGIDPDSLQHAYNEIADKEDEDK